MKYRIILLMLLLFVANIAAEDTAGTTGFTFLKVNYSARAAAMGNAYTGLADDAGAVFFNPAGMVQVKSPQASATYMSYFDGIQCGSAAFVLPRNEKLVLGFFAKGLTATEDRTLADEMGQYDGTDGTYGMSNIVLGASVARYLINILDVGMSVKYIRESLDENLKLGITFRNFGKQLSYYTESEYEENLPRTITAGFNYHPNEKLYVTLDIHKPLDYDFSGRIGCEYQLHEMLALRAGYKTNASDWKAGGDHDAFSGMSFGTGFNLDKYNLKIDYAIVSYGDLGFVNQVTMNYLF